MKQLMLTLSLILLIPLSVFAALTIQWDPPVTNEDGSQLTDLAGYTLYVGRTQSGIYEESVNIADAAAIDYVYTISGAKDGDIFYFAMDAYDTSGNHSVKSNEVSYTVPITIPSSFQIRIVFIP